MMITLPVTRPLANHLPGSAGWGHPRPVETAQLGLIAGDGGCVRPRPMPPHNCWDPRTWCAVPNSPIQSRVPQLFAVLGMRLIRNACISMGGLGAKLELA